MDNRFPDKRVPEKKARLLEALDKGMAMVHLDARRPGVLVPEHLKGELHLMLNLSYRFDPPDLSVGEWGIRQTLTFQGRSFTVAIPWSALYAILFPSGDQMGIELSCDASSVRRFGAASPGSMIQMWPPVPSCLCTAMRFPSGDRSTPR